MVSLKNARAKSRRVLHAIPVIIKSISLEQLSYLAIAIGIPLFFYQSALETHRDRVAYSMEFLSDFQTPKMVEHRYALMKPWLQYNLERLDGLHIPSSVRDDLVFKVVASSSDENDLRRSIFAVVDFFDKLAICQDARLCDKHIANSYLAHYATRFYCLYGPYIRLLRKEQAMTGFGVRLEQLVDPAQNCSR